MFKEFAAGCAVLIILYIICKQIQKKAPGALRIIILSVLGLCIVLQVVYNCLVMFPGYYMETPRGKWRFGTFSENLLAYNDGWDFRDEILQPILKHRSIKLDDTAPYYRKYFELLSPSCETASFEQSMKESVFSHEAEFDFKTTFETFRIMDYVKEPDLVPAELTEMFEEEEAPDLYIHMESVKEEDKLVCLVNEDHAAFILGEKKLAEYTSDPAGMVSADTRHESCIEAASTEGGARYVQ